MISSGVQLSAVLILGVALIWAQETDMLDLLSAIEDQEQTTSKDFSDILQLQESLVTINCRLSCSLLDYSQTCGCVKKRCCLWKNPCVALCNGARILGEKEDSECRGLSVQVHAKSP
uniref:Chitin elicitor-binding protein n=1 Tax=Lygus hesperus TaxID=30085 RepID=A0A0A9W9K0_LYGHE